MHPLDYVYLPSQKRVKLFYIVFPLHMWVVSPSVRGNTHTQQHMSQLLLLGKFEYGGGSIFKVVLECYKRCSEPFLRGEREFPFAL